MTQKRVCLYTVKGTGHNLYYFNILIKQLIKHQCQVSIIVPHSCIGRAEFKSFISGFEAEIEVVTHKDFFSTNIFKNSWEECKGILEGLNKLSCTPDIVLAPNGSQIPFLWPLFFQWHKATLSRVSSFRFGMLSVGLDFSSPPMKMRITNLIRSTLLKLNQAATLKTIDAFGYEHLPKSLTPKFTLVPDPMDNINVVSKDTAKAYFDIPQETFVISISGALNSHPRKNTKLLIQAISSLENKSICLLMAGKLSKNLQDYLKALDGNSQERIYCVNRYLSDEELTIATCASDVVCTPYLDHFSPSGIVLRAIKCNVPALIPNYHWFKFMCDKFKIGWMIPSLEKEVLASAILLCYSKLKENSWVNHHQDDLVRYFSEENFFYHWMSEFIDIPAGGSDFPCMKKS